ncbi:MAG: DUF3747 domain-containing protein [Cyanothece sp. SIO1E1]|nr:DUF3747 domain-containing protein [Cyanothece sp. SIO1E1]
MKRGLWSRLTAFAVLGLGVSNFGATAIAAAFAHRELAPGSVIAVAAPIAEGASHQLLVLEQLSRNRPCWRERGDRLATIEPLLLNFDFTGICGRGTDSNGYSVRVGGEDMGWRYRLRVVEGLHNLRLLAVPVTDRQAPTLEIGRTRGITDDFSKIELNSGWRLTKRAYNGQTLGHFYLTHNQDLATLAETSSSVASRSHRRRPDLTPVPPRRRYRQPNLARFESQVPAGTIVLARYQAAENLYIAANETVPIPMTLTVTEDRLTRDGRRLIPATSRVLGEVRIDQGEARFYGQELILPSGRQFPINVISNALAQPEARRPGIRGGSVLSGAALGAAVAATVSAITGDRAIDTEEVLGGAGLGALLGVFLGRGSQPQTESLAIAPNTDMNLTFNSSVALY